MRSSRGENTVDEVLEKVKPRGQNWKEFSHILENFERRVFESLFGNELEFFFLGEDRFSTPFAFPLFLRKSCSLAEETREERAHDLSLSH